MARDLKEAISLANQRLIKSLDQLVNDRSFLLRIGKASQDLVYRRTKTGYGVSSLEVEKPKKTKLKSLHPNYVEYRKGLGQFQKKKGEAPKARRVRSNFSSASKSNLTLTGQMLDSISIDVITRGVRLFIENTKRDGETQTNADVAQFVSEARPFFALTDDEQLVILRLIEREIRTLARRI
jgi:hypothetical protein